MKQAGLLRVIMGCWIIISLLPGMAAAATVLYATTTNPTGSSTPPGILRIDENGQFTTWNINWGGSPISLQNPQGIDLDGSGNVYVNDGANIYKITPAGNGSLFATKPNANNARGLAIDSAGNVYATGRDGSADVIYRYNSAGVLTATWNGSANGLEAGPDGRIYAADPDAGMVWRYDSMGNRSGFFGESGSWDIAFDSAGYLYISSLGGYVIQSNPTGSHYNNYYSSGSLRAGGIEIGHDGTAYFANRRSTTNNEIRMYTPWGHSDTFADFDEDRQVNFMVAAPEPGSVGLIVLAVCAAALHRRR